MYTKSTVLDRILVLFCRAIMESQLTGTLALILVSSASIQTPLPCPPILLNASTKALLHLPAQIPIHDQNKQDKSVLSETGWTLDETSNLELTRYEMLCWREMQYVIRHISLQARNEIVSVLRNEARHLLEYRIFSPTRSDQYGVTPGPRGLATLWPDVEQRHPSLVALTGQRDRLAALLALLEWTETHDTHLPQC
jgi:hypothetical protein